MCLDEFIDMMTRSDLVDENFGQREIGPLWNVSMMTSKDEITSERHLNMNFVEFLEALARCADKFKVENMHDYFPEYKAKNKYKLDKKLETIIIELIRANMSEKQYNYAFNKYKDTVEKELTNPKATKFARKP